MNPGSEQAACEQQRQGNGAVLFSKEGEQRLDITDDVDKFMMFNHDNIGSRLASKLGLSQSPGKDVMKRFATRTRELHQQQQGRTLDQAAMMAAKEIFPGEFQPTRYAGANQAIEPLLIEIENL